MTAQEPERRCIGSVASVNIARRVVRLRLEPPPARIGGIEWVEVEFGTGSPLRCKVTGASVHGSTAALELGPGVPRDTVARMKGGRVWADEPVAPRQDELPLGAELIGFEARLLDGAGLGRIDDAFTTPAHDVVEVRQPDGRQCLLPVVEPLFAEVDWDHGVVYVHDIAPFAVYNED